MIAKNFLSITTFDVSAKVHSDNASWKLIQTIANNRGTNESRVNILKWIEINWSVMLTLQVGRRKQSSEKWMLELADPLWEQNELSVIWRNNIFKLFNFTFAIAFIINKPRINWIFFSFFFLVLNFFFFQKIKIKKLFRSRSLFILWKSFQLMIIYVTCSLRYWEGRERERGGEYVRWKSKIIMVCFKINWEAYFWNEMKFLNWPMMINECESHWTMIGSMMHWNDSVVNN